MGAQPGIDRLNELVTIHMGSHDILVTMSLDFANTLSAGDVEVAITSLEAAIKSKHPSVKRIFIEAQSWRGHLDSRDAGATPVVT